MRRNRPSRRRHSPALPFLVATVAAGASVLALALFAGGCSSTRHGSAPRGRAFATPEQAVDALAASAEDPARADELLGPGGKQTVAAADEAAVEEGLVDGGSSEGVHGALAELIDRGVSVADVGPDVCLVLIGEEHWELPTPLVRDADGWRFDLGAGSDELRCREIGENELRAIATLRELVDAQLEYRDRAIAGGRPAYAAKWSSDDGKHDGLYWKASAGEPPSPLGPLFCRDAVEHPDSADSTRSAPCHGYVYRILTRRGEPADSARDGAPRSDDAALRAEGFAFFAWPAEYEKSGVKTFFVDEAGLVFEKDLGSRTPEQAPKLTFFDPDDSWAPVAD